MDGVELDLVEGSEEAGNEEQHDTEELVFVEVEAAGDLHKPEAHEECAKAE